MGKGKKALLAFVFLPLLTNGMERKVQILSKVFICFLVYLMEFQLVKAKRSRNLIPFELILVVKHGNYLYLLRHREKRSSDASSVFTFISRFDHSSMTRNSGKNTLNERVKNHQHISGAFPRGNPERQRTISWPLFRDSMHIQLMEKLIEASQG